MNIKILILITFIFSFCSNSFSQSDSINYKSQTTQIDKTYLEELLLENSFEDLEDSKLLDYLEDLESHPIDLNTATIEDLEEIPFISSNLAREIIVYRNKYFPIKSKRELLEIDNLTEETYELIKNFFIVKKDTTFIDEKDLENQNNEKNILFKNFGLRYRTRFQQELQTKEGYLNGNYPGSKAKIYNQLNFNYLNEKYLLEGNITIEKDPGEKSLADFYSGFIELKNYKRIKNAVLGDYSLNFGQGIGMWSGLGFSKGSVTVDAIKKRGNSIKGYSSVNESQFFRGAAIDIKYKDLNFLTFFSNNYFDASIDTTLDEISSFYFDGYHRNISESNRKNSAKEVLIGTRGYYSKENIQIGVTYWTSKFSKSVGTDSSKRLYNFSGDKANILSFDYDLIYKNMNLYGEFARSQSGAVASIGALRFNFGKIANFVFLYRNYPENFSPVHSFGFGEKNGNTQNEVGLYSGAFLYPYKGLFLSVYYDQFKFPYRSYTETVSVLGNDLLLNINWSVNKNLDINVRYKNENKEGARSVTDEFGRTIKKIDNRNLTNFRIGFDYNFTNKFRIRSRYDYVFINYKFYGGNNKGYLFYTDFRFIPIFGLSVSTRLIFFDTENYDSRIYEYEDDISGVMSNVALYEKGRRWYTLLKYKPLNFLKIYLKYSETYIDGAKSIGTGNDQIHKNVNNKINIGLEINLY